MPENIVRNRISQPSFQAKVAAYLFEELTRSEAFIISPEAADLHKQFNQFLKTKKALTRFEESLSKLEQQPIEQFHLLRQWLMAFIEQEEKTELTEFVHETAVLLLTNQFESKNIVQTPIKSTLDHLHGDHPVIEKGQYELDYNAFINKLERYQEEVIPKYEAYVNRKKVLLEHYKKQLRLEEFKPRILSSFVRNKLIDEVYLPLIGDNLAKQLGTADAATRTDRMGLLLLISPPGYGKTTLMEYIANRLGLIFMKINGPAIGHKVTSLDPVDAPNRAAKQELEKLNLSFEMGDNVLIYLDDIQHCNPEFLQKFISLCDAQRKIEGVWKGNSKTYDFRGKRVGVVMAGNPYTESGEKFQIPDMLANRADIYNLGDIIGDKGAVFKLSYIENAISSNASLARLANKSMKDVYKLIQVAETGNNENLQLEGNHTPEELNEYLSVLKKLIRVRDLVLKVNQEYIRSAAMNDDYRTEPAFKLQGSYRNMAKLAEKVIPIMNEQELNTLLLAHYEGESQTLTDGAEANFLKLKELMGTMTEEELARWDAIKETFQKNQTFRGLDENNPFSQVIAQLGQFTDELAGIKKAIQKGIDSN